MLTRIFSGPIVRYGRQTYNSLKRRQLDRFRNHFNDTSGLEFKIAETTPFTNLQTQWMQSQNRAERYADFDQQEFCPLVATAFDIYADEITTHSSLEPMLKIECANQEIKDVLRVLYNDILSLDHNLYYWTRNLPVKYDTLIPMLDGSVATIAEISERVKNDEDIYVYSIQDKTDVIAPGHVIWCDKNYTTETIIKVWLDNDTFVETAPEHPFVMRDGSSKSR